MNELINKKEELLKEIDDIDNQIRLKKLDNFIQFLKTEKQNYMLNQNFDEWHYLMEDIVKLVNTALISREIKAIYCRYSHIEIDGEVNLSDNEDFICLSDNYNCLYDIIGFFEKEAKLRKEDKLEEVYLSNHRLDNFLINIEDNLYIKLDWYEKNKS